MCIRGHVICNSICVKNCEKCLGRCATFGGKLFPVCPVHRNKVHLLYNPMVVESFPRVILMLRWILVLCRMIIFLIYFSNLKHVLPSQTFARSLAYMKYPMIVKTNIHLEFLHIIISILPNHFRN